MYVCNYVNQITVNSPNESRQSIRITVTTRLSILRPLPITQKLCVGRKFSLTDSAADEVRYFGGSCPLLLTVLGEVILCS